MLNLLSLDEAAQELRLSIHTIRAWVFQRRFATVRLGRRRLIERETLEEFVRNGVIGARAKASEPTAAIESGKGYGGKHRDHRRA